MTDASQPDLGTEPETLAERETMLGQADAIRAFGDERQSDVVRELVSRGEPRHDPARLPARTVPPKRQHLLVRPVRRDRQVDDLETAVGQEPLQSALQHLAVRLFVADLKAFGLAVANEQD